MTSKDFDRRLGEHLRRLRKLQGLSLLDVEAASGKEFKASVLGAYERGERAVSAVRLARLAELYRVPVQSMLPREGAPASDGSGLSLDLQRVEAAQGVEADIVRRFLRGLQGRRAEWPARVVTIRADDVWALAAALDRAPQELAKRLDELGLRAF